MSYKDIVSYEDIPKITKRVFLLSLIRSNPINSKYSRVEYDNLANFFNQLLSHSRIKGKIHGGFYAFETIGYLGDHDCSFNINIHAFLFSRSNFISVNTIKKVWQKITGDSYKVSLSPVDDVESAFKEVLGYGVMPPHLGDAKSHALYVIETQDIKLFDSFGSYRGRVEDTREEKHEDSHVCKDCGGHMEFLAEYKSDSPLS